MELGSRIRFLRNQQNLTLEDLSARTRVSRTMLFDIERGIKNPIIIVLTRKQQRQILVDPQTGVERHHLCPAFLRRGIEVILYIIPPGQTGSFPPHRLGVVEHITIMRGQIKCSLDDWEEILIEGDSIFFPAHIAHDFYNPGSEPCHFFLLIDSGQVERNSYKLR